MKISQHQHGTCHGFNLVELIACMAIGCIVLSFSYPMIGSLSQGNDMTHSLQTIAGTLENARQEAISKNTYVWVAFADPEVNDEDKTPLIVLVSSRTGLDPLKGAPANIDLADHPDLEIGKAQKLKSIQILNSSSFSLPNLPPVEQPPAPPEEVAWNIWTAGETKRFNRAILFNPTGQASTAGFNRYIEFGISPANGNSSNQAIVRTAAITGRSRIYRAE